MQEKMKSDIRKLKDTLWELCRRIIKTRHGNVCYTCGARGLEGSNWHIGHCIPSSVGGVLLRYNLDNFRPQCASCNIWKSGNGAIFMRKLLIDLGEARVDAMIALKNQSVKADKWWYQSQIQAYETLVSQTS